MQPHIQKKKTIRMQNGIYRECDGLYKIKNI